MSALLNEVVGNLSTAPIRLDGSTCQVAYDAEINRRSQDGSLLVHADSISHGHNVRATVCDPAAVDHSPAGTGFYTNCSSFRQGQDGAGTNIQLVVGTLEHDLYAINEAVCFPCPPENLVPGRNATYSVLYTLPFNSFAGLTTSIWPPFPIFDISTLRDNNAESFLPVDAGTVRPPLPDRMKVGPNDTFYNATGILPAVTYNVAS